MANCEIPMVNRKQFKAQGSTLHVAHCTSRGGFTIIELLVSILLTSIIMGAIYSVYRVQTHSAKAQENRLEAQEYARSVLDMMVREIRNAAYNPLSAVAGDKCANGVLAGAPNVFDAAATSLSFTYDFQGGVGGVPDGDCNDSDEVITYTYDTSGCASGYGNVTRNGSGNPLTICNVTSFDVRYFKQDGTELSRPVTTELPNIQRVMITLTVKSLKPDTEFGGQLTATMTSNADLRNRGLPS